MKAIVYHDYGSPDVLKYEEIEKPVPKDNEVLIKVRAASLNPLDWRLMKGQPSALRIFFGLRRPRFGRPGVDVAGVVEAVGKNATRFKSGDEVFGACRGACAEYARAPDSGLVKKPASVTFEQAASVNVAALTALQGLRDKGNLQPGQRVLINGAAGGVGTFAVQMAKWLGAEVTGVCSTRNLEMLRSIGADQVIDYTRQDFTKGGQRYDVILDNVANHQLSAIRRVLNTKGRYVIVGAPHTVSMIELLGGLLKPLMMSLFVSQRLSFFMAKPNKEDLTIIGDLISSGKVTPVIDRRYRLSEVPEAIRYLEEGHARGKVVIVVE